MTRKLALLAPAFLSLGAPLAAQDEIFAITDPVPLNPEDPSQDEIGELIYRGGVVIEPGEEGIGGISGLEWYEEDGLIYAVSDDGHWLTIEPDEFDGRLIDILAITRGDLLDERGRRLRGENADAEAITRGPAGNNWLVTFEREHRVWIYEDLSETAEPVADQWTRHLRPSESNAGFEAAATWAGGAIACLERHVEGSPNCLTFPTKRQFEFTPPPSLAEKAGVPTDAACLDENSCFILFRSFVRGEGNRAAIVHYDPASEENEVLAVLTPPLTLDNFEGIAVREQFGKTYLYIVSDNNFSDDQRTLLMKFEIRTEEVMVAPDPEPEINYATEDVVLETSLGDITIRLETERAPITAANFLRYVDEDRFDGIVFYRAMKLDREPQPNGLIQAGVRFDPARVLPPIPHEPTNLTGLTHTNGALSMAMGEPGSANGDFSIMLQDQIGLDARPDAEDPVWQNGYAVFGYVIEGMEVVSAIHSLPADPDAGQGIMRGQMLAEPVEIIEARRVLDTIEITAPE
ncbi:MAG: esterase-like activity of phytase family protein [Pseudomonadota bacterium]